MPTERVIKVKVDSSIYNKAIEYKINIEDYLAKSLQRRIIEITHEKDQEKRWKDLHEKTNENKIYEIIRRISKKYSKFGYASKDSIIAEAELEGITREEINRALYRLEEKKEIFKPAKDNYQITKVK